MTQNRMTIQEWLRKGLNDHGGDLVREMLSMMAQWLMSADVDALCGAEYGARSSERTNQRNGYRSRRWDTRAGSIDLEIPRLRQGSYFPDWLLDPRRRSERALASVVAEAYVNGVSTRKVERLAKSLGINSLSKTQASEMAKGLDEMVESFRSRPLDAGPYPFLWLDAMEIKSREAGRVVNVTLVQAIGVNANGHREILGVDVVTAEDGAAWLSFLRGLVSRGLSGVQLAISDAHPGARNAIASVFPGAAWQRCRTHFMTNLLTRVPKAAQPVVATLVRSIFAQPDAESVRAQHGAVVDQLEQRFPEASNLLDAATEEILAFTHFPKSLWRQIWSNNPLERLNKEVRRRTDVVGIFPNRAALLRLAGALLAEQNDEWLVSRRYMSLDALRTVLEPPPAQLDDADEQLALSA